MSEAHDLLPAELRSKLPPLYATEEESDPMVWVKWFTPDSSWTWYIIEFDGEDLCFGFVNGLEQELGYFSLGEIQSIRRPGGLRVERDLYYEPTKLSEVRKTLDRP